MTIHIGIDLMGNDKKPEDILSGIIDFAKNLKEDIEFTFFATRDLRLKFEKIEKEKSFPIKVVYVEYTPSLGDEPDYSLVLEAARNAL